MDGEGPRHANPHGGAKTRRRGLLRAAAQRVLGRGESRGGPALPSRQGRGRGGHRRPRGKGEGKGGRSRLAFRTIIPRRYGEAPCEVRGEPWCVSEGIWGASAGLSPAASAEGRGGEPGSGGEAVAAAMPTPPGFRHSPAVPKLPGGAPAREQSRRDAPLPGEQGCLETCAGGWGEDQNQTTPHQTNTHPQDQDSKLGFRRRQGGRASLPACRAYRLRPGAAGRSHRPRLCPPRAEGFGGGAPRGPLPRPPCGTHGHAWEQAGGGSRRAASSRPRSTCRGSCASRRASDARK